MAKEILKKELVYMDLDKKEARFFTIELLSVGYNQIQVISTSGNFNNKGREHIVRFEGEHAFKEGRKLLYKKFLEKKAEGFMERADIDKWHKAFHEKYVDEHLIVLESHRAEKKKEHGEKKKTISRSKNKSIHKGSKCDLCKKPIPEKMSLKINEWARGEGNWDQNPDFIGFKKLLCIDCQIEQDIFKKKI